MKIKKMCAVLYVMCAVLYIFFLFLIFVRNDDVFFVLVLDLSVLDLSVFDLSVFDFWQIPLLSVSGFSSFLCV